MSEPFPGFKALVPYFDKDKWGGLDGTWYKRYTKLANNDENGSEVRLGASERLRGFAENFRCSNDDGGDASGCYYIHPHPSMKTFFEDLIFERKKVGRTAQRNYIKTSIEVLDEARTYGAQEIISEIPEALRTKRSFTGGIVPESSKKIKAISVSASSSSADESEEINYSDTISTSDQAKTFGESHPTSTIPTTPPPSSPNYKQPRFITNNEYMDMDWSPWQFDEIICEIDIEEKLIGLFEKEKKAKKKSSLSYGIIDLNDSRIMNVLGQSVKFYFEEKMKKYKPQRSVSKETLETLKSLNVTSLWELGKALSNSSELQEGWYNSNIVAPFFDDCLASLNDYILRRKIEFIYVETATTSILSKRDKDLSKLHEAIAIMFKFIVSSLPEKIVYEISDLPILCIQFCGTTADVYLANWPIKMRLIVFSIMDFDIPEQVASLPSLTKSAVRMLTLRSLIQDLHKRYQLLLKNISDYYLDNDNNWTSPLKLKAR
ncbi:hypothetical protein Glove_311g39 [Diversispora epigaea]|uniref:Uncharacterized protein n=1 Tax=Diversispora epigaea TaxID=1348612 RepID=A0A397HSH3_9GLOM|nr:hypothetical protein Glove_311g39 [Diversispora epigaea]